MGQNLPPVLPSGPSSMPSRPQTSVRRNAGNISVSATQQKKDIEGAAVSMNQMMSGKRGAQPTSSVTRIGANAHSEASTSITHTNEAKHSIHEYETAEEEAARDYRRDSYIRRMIKKRKAAEAQAAKEAAANAGIHTGIGKVFRKTGVTGFRRRMNKMFRKDRATYKNLSAADKKLFEDIVEETLDPQPVGHKTSRLDRKKMGRKVFKKWKEGKITKSDYKDMKKIIGQLD